VNASGITFSQAPQVQLGACLGVCDLFSTQAQCAANASGRPFGCQVDPIETDLSTGKGVCLPTIQNAPGTGGTCESDAVNSLTALDWPCTDRTFCSSLFDFYNAYNTGTYAGPIPGVCTPYCNFTNCPAAQPCQTTCPAASLCFGVGPSDAGPQLQTGFCLPLPSDAGTRVDAGLPPDASVPADAGLDAGGPDASVPPGVDAGDGG
jgi:hypothetical protein